MSANTGKTAQNPYSPSTLNQMLKMHLSEQFGSFWLTGELFETYQSPIGHQYFTLKDQQASIKCVMFKQKQNPELKQGSKIVLLGNLSIYAPKGDIQVNVLRVMTTGQGDLAQQFLILKQKLQVAGLFDQQNKQKIPKLISNVGIITSPKSAALQDILNILRQKNPLIELTLYPTQVQGDEAAPQINHALRTADEAGHDVLLLTRGGGSKEDLWTFNDEFMAHQLAQLKTPVISAVGHETDESISDLVADFSCITPSAAADYLSGDFKQVCNDLNNKHQLLQLLAQDKIRQSQQSVDSKFHLLQKNHPLNLLNKQKAALDAKALQLHNVIQSKWQRINNQLNQQTNSLKLLKPNLNAQQMSLLNLQQNLNQTIKQKVITRKQALSLKVNDLNHQNPLHVLSRGYSITQNLETGAVITDVNQTKNGDEVVTQFKSGRIHAKIFERLEK